SKKKQIRTHAKTVGELLEDLHIETRNEDRITPSKQTALADNMNVVYEAAKQIRVTRGGEEKTLWSTAKTVGAFLNEQHTPVNQHDKID
ncbi:ubiquitin-like domain-containing protein, partial [Bacillus tropicus]|uniref:ubiquitin-like domain-containing protein n=1 Tax=Bacillus tropicus TaxID=2026188 RepID=UPI0011BD078E